MSGANTGIIGTLGNIVFSWTPKKKLTFSEYERETSARWEENPVHLGTPRAQYVGSELDTASMEIVLLADHGIDPRVQMARLQDYCRMGKVMPLIFGGKAEGRGKWRITKVGTANYEIDNRGNVLKCKVVLSLGEYV